jgi:hypothetical protein
MIPHSIDQITAFSFCEFGNILVIGDAFGKVSLAKLSSFTEDFRPMEYQIAESPIIACHIACHDFMAVVDSKRMVHIYSIDSQKDIDRLKFSMDPNCVRVIGPYLFLFSELSLIGYRFSFFTRKWANLPCNAVRIIRCPARMKAARILCYLENRGVAIFSPRDAHQLFGFGALASGHEIQIIDYARDVLLNGASCIPIQCEDTLFVSLAGGLMAFISLDHPDDKLRPSASNDWFQSTIPNSEMYSFPIAVAKSPSLIRFMSSFGIETKEMHNCV